MALTLGQRVRQLREAKGLEPEELARQIGVNRTTLSRYESDSIDPPSTTLKAVAATLEVRAAYLLGEIPEFEEMSPREVAAREALRLFLASIRPTDPKRVRYWRATELPQAPKTVERWKEFDELLRRILGRHG